MPFLSHTSAGTNQAETVYTPLLGIALLAGNIGGNKFVSIAYESSETIEIETDDVSILAIGVAGSYLFKLFFLLLALCIMRSIYQAQLLA